MDEPTFRYFVVTHRGKTFVYSDAAIAALEPGPKPGAENDLADWQAKEADYAAVMNRGRWVEIWLRSPVARHKGEIAQLCQVPDEVTGFRFDPAREAAARVAVLVERWNGIDEKPGFEAGQKLPSPLDEFVNAEIGEHLYPTARSADFFTRSNAV